MKRLKKFLYFLYDFPIRWEAYHQSLDGGFGIHHILIFFALCIYLVAFILVSNLSY